MAKVGLAMLEGNGNHKNLAFSLFPLGFTLQLLRPHVLWSDPTIFPWNGKTWALLM